MNTKHYVCKGGCGNVSDYPGTCSAEGCKDYGKEFAACACEDDQHLDAGRPESEDDREEKVETF